MRLAGPLILNNLLTTGMGFVDTVMSGRLGPDTLGAVAVGSSVWVIAFLTGLGLLMAVNPITAHRVGAGRPGRVGYFWRQSVWLALALSLVMSSVLWWAPALLARLGVVPAILPGVQGYLHAIVFGLPLMFLFLTLRFVSEGLGSTRPIMYAALIAFAVNILGNYVLMFGRWGFPALGALGCGAATALGQASMLVVLAIYMVRQPRYRPLKLFRRFEWPRMRPLKEITVIGLPIGGQILAEAGLFSCVGVLMATMGTMAVAGHQIAMNYAATMFMIPLAFTSAITVRVGHALGAADPALAQLRGRVGIAMCGGFMVLSAVAMLLFSGTIVSFYTNDIQVQAVAVSLLGVAAVFQVSDGLQVGANGALRGYKDTAIPMWLALFSYWGIGFPMAWVLGVRMGLGPRWVWVGLAVSLTVAAVLLLARFVYISRRGLGAFASSPQSIDQSVEGGFT